MNLQVTSVLALLSQFPHPYLHEYLLNPTLSLTPGTTSLSTVLREVCSSILPFCIHVYTVLMYRAADTVCDTEENLLNTLIQVQITLKIQII